MLCPTCAAFNYAKRDQHAGLKGGVALVTGGRLKIGYQTVLCLLGDGARVLVTTRFPRDAALRFRAEPDFDLWQHRLRIYGLDLRNLCAVEWFIAHLLETESDLDLRHNGITGAGRAYLVTALKRNTTLCDLRLDGKPDPNILTRLERNIALRLAPHPSIPRDVMLIRSVYRTTTARPSTPKGEQPS